jgi:inositol-phosphate phosphatase/L-galactose 1-phosphate phosphatase/histidinol-phosphatase
MADVDELSGAGDRADGSLVDFGVHLASHLALPALATGYGRLVRELRQNYELMHSARGLNLDTALAGGDPALAHLRKSNGELVTTAELEAERAMREAVGRRCPDDAVVGEEHGYRPGGRNRWVFDPIDGTSAMVRAAMADAYGLSLPEPRPAFGITVALVSGSVATLGIVTELRAEHGRLAAVNTWVGSVGRPTTLNGRPVSSPTSPDALHEARLASTVPEVMFGTPWKWGRFHALRDATAGCVTDQNCIGFMHLLGSEEQVHVVYEADLAYHDVAALVPILRGAGIAVTDDRGSELRFNESRIGSEFRVLAAAPELHRAALATLRAGAAPDQRRVRPDRSPSRGYTRKFEAPGALARAEGSTD